MSTETFSSGQAALTLFKAFFHNSNNEKTKNIKMKLHFFCVLSFSRLNLNNISISKSKKILISFLFGLRLRTKVGLEVASLPQQISSSASLAL